VHPRRSTNTLFQRVMEATRVMSLPAGVLRTFLRAVLSAVVCSLCLGGSSSRGSDEAVLLGAVSARRRLHPFRAGTLGDVNASQTLSERPLNALLGVKAAGPGTFSLGPGSATPDNLPSATPSIAERVPVSLAGQAAERRWQLQQEEAEEAKRREEAGEEDPSSFQGADSADSLQDSAAVRSPRTLRTPRNVDDCPICMSPISPSSAAMRCHNKHYFHARCMQRCTFCEWTRNRTPSRTVYSITVLEGSH